MREIRPEQEQCQNVLLNTVNRQVPESDYMFIQTRFQNPDLPTNTAFDGAIHIMSLKEHAFEKKLRHFGTFK